MLLILKPLILSTRSTISELFIDGARECFTLEDAVRPGPKIPGRTAIPAGTYDLTIDMSARFKRPMPRLLNVPGFTGSRIHPGNDDADTEGCILVGENWKEDALLDSRSAFHKLFLKLQAALAAGEAVQISISRSTAVRHAVPSPPELWEGV